MKSNIGSFFSYGDDNRVHQGNLYRDIKIIIDYDITDVEEIVQLKMPYMFILSQECDLKNDFESFNDYTSVMDKEQYFNALNKEEDFIIENNKCENKTNKKFIDEFRPIHDKCIPSILSCPAFPAEEVREGFHLFETDYVVMDEKGNPKKTKWKSIKRNETPRYHYIEGDTIHQIPELVIDFKRYYTIPKKYLYSIHNSHFMASLNELFRDDLSSRFAHYQSRIGLPNLY